MKHAAVLIAGLLAVAALAGCAGSPREKDQALRGILLPAEEILRDGAAATTLSGLEASGFNAIVAAVGDQTTGEAIEALVAGAADAELPLHLWLNVGRNPRLADARPEWIGGMGSHEDWRRLHPSAPRPREGERIGVYPWVPVRYRAVFDDRLAAIEKLLAGRTEGIASVFLHGLQAPPSACGCGNDQCRWTVDYGMPGGPVKMENAPAAFLAALRERLPGVRWVPVWVTECEDVDQEEGGTGYCGEVHCYDGLCWQASTSELEALAREARSEGEGEGPIALLLAEGAFRRNLPRYARTGGWISRAIRLLATVPPAHGHAPVPPGRIIAVVEGTRGGAEERNAVSQAIGAGARGVIIAKMPLEEGWEPRLLPAAAAR